MKPILTHCTPTGQLATLSDRMRHFILASYADAGHTALVLDHGTLGRMILQVQTIRDIRNEMAQYGLRFVDAHAPFGHFEDLNTSLSECRKPMIERNKAALEICREFGVDTITIHVGNTRQPGTTFEELHDNLLRSLDELLPVAEACGVTICIENIWHPTNTAEKLLDAIRRFPTEALGICYDAGHANITSGKERGPENHCAAVAKEEGVEPVWNDHLLEDLLPHVVNCHLHDNDGIYDLHHPVGHGTIDWSHIRPLLLSAPRLRAIQNESAAESGHALPIHVAVEEFRALIEDGTIPRPVAP